mmetsp:Transcript_19571/g.28152  ORF Transcript_19571/g.28152 Transcript_19571/m.28152 type:complete len:172 (-) Transcript_19571:160-675(-)|eukprot:CAMPEP_0185029710 /NCGR_PEP_ID=MMETSP1103-20130426/16177_1 /TAXON_ID=36769 /ORGANISM="Paraphysomonas bandaiensis, Strain Caron Lab Isolate" /LENGTH=171 /DNA_ID=CAMNT_0027564549 /DNA_START=19 /DNA_END=534 /DNA_ORIENTATION=+
MSSRKIKAEEMMRQYTSEFSEVQVAKSEDILELKRKGDCPVVLIDVREREEYEVSMIPGAITSTEFNTLRNESEIDENTILIPYCTIGYRSGLYSRKLIADGYKNVRNGEGIVLWTYSGGRLVRRDGKNEVNTDRVHTYGSKWDVASEEFKSVQFSSWYGIYKGVRSYFGL